MCLVSLGLLDPNIFFYMGFLSLSLVSQKLVGVCFPQLHGTNTYRRVVSLGLETQTNIFGSLITQPPPLPKPRLRPNTRFVSPHPI